METQNAVASKPNPTASRFAARQEKIGERMILLGVWVLVIGVAICWGVASDWWWAEGGKKRAPPSPAGRGLHYVLSMSDEQAPGPLLENPCPFSGFRALN